MMQKNQTLKMNISLHLITISLLKKVVVNSTKSKNLVDKSDITGLENNADFVATFATKAELKGEQDKIIKLEALDSCYYRGKSHFEDDDTQNYFIF